MLRLILPCAWVLTLPDWPIFVYMNITKNLKIGRYSSLCLKCWFIQGSCQAAKNPLNPLDIYLFYIMLSVCVRARAYCMYFQIVYACSCVRDYPCIVPLCVFLRSCCRKQARWCLIQSLSALVGWRPGTVRENNRGAEEWTVWAVRLWWFDLVWTGTPH